MTIEKAVEQLIASEKFQEKARQDARLRVFLQRYREGKVKNGMAINLLKKFGYKIEASTKKVA